MIDIETVRITLTKVIVIIVSVAARSLSERKIFRALDNQRKPLSFRAKIILLVVLLLMITFDVSSIMICYFCCGISSRNRLGLGNKTRKSSK